MTTHTHGAEKLPRTSALGRLAIATALSNPSRHRKDIVAQRWPDAGEGQRALIVQAAAVPSNDYPASTAAGQLYTGIAQQTLLGRLNVLADVKLRAAFGAFAGGEPTGTIRTPSQPIPLLQLPFAKCILDPIQAAALIVISNELAEDANAESGIRDLVLRATTKAADTEFIARALDGASATASGADSPFQLRAQVREMVLALVAAGANAGLITLSAHPSTLVLLATASDPMGNAAFPTVSVTGGTLCGLPLLPSLGVAADSIVAVAGDAVLRAAGIVDITPSEHAHLEFASDPTGAAEPGETPVAQSKVRVSLWQNGMRALRVRFTFGADFVRETRAAFIDGITLEGGTA